LIKKLKSMLKANDSEVKFVLCKTQVDSNAIKRTEIDGVEHIIVSSKTLPDDIVMNGGLYPVDEINKSYSLLENTLAPIGHPTDKSGNYISAVDPTAINNFYGGAYNKNVRREGNRILMDKVINVEEAKKSERGLRLLSRIKELETSQDAEPIHTSVAAFLKVETLETPATNNRDEEYTWIARDIVFDHDAILLDEAGAATPEKGVGMAVNSEGKQFQVDQTLVTIDADELGEMSYSEIARALETAINTPPLSGGYIVEIFEDRVIYESGEMFFSVPYIMDGKKAKIAGIPLPVDRNVAYIPKTNQEGDLMKEMIINKLKDAGIEVSGLSDEQLLVKYSELNATNADEQAKEDKLDLDVIVNNAVKPLVEKIESLEAKVNASDEAELNELADAVINSKKYDGLDIDAAKKLGIDVLKNMSANCSKSAGIPLTVVNGEKEADYDLPA